VHEAHHHLYFPTSRYVTAGPPRRIALLARGVECSTSRLANALTRVAHFLFYFGLGLVVICLPAWVLSRNPAFVAGALAALVVVSDLFIRVHDAIHRPGSHPWLERQAWFRFLDKHHFIHHVDEDANVNFLLPLGDFMFGSLRTALTSGELRRHGSREDAKRLPRGLAAARGRVLPPAP
jgi:hypothetical protein